MKILITGKKNCYSLSTSFYRAFTKLGIDIKIFDDEGLYKKKHSFLKNRYTHRLFWKVFSLPLQKEFIKTVNYEKPDLILILKGWFFSQSVLKKIKGENPQTKLFCFNPDNPFNNWHFGISNDNIRQSIPLYDVYFIWGKFLIDQLKIMGAKRVEYLPFGYDSELHYPVKVNKEEKNIYGSDLAFIGSWDKEREWWLSHLLDYNLIIWGNGWHKANRKLQTKCKKKPVIGEEFSKVCISSKIILNLIRKQNIPAHNMRTFETPACKGFVLSRRTEEVTSFFKENEEITCFSSPQELKKKINFYSKKEELRQKIAQRAFEKVKNYTYLERAKKILNIYEEYKK